MQRTLLLAAAGTLATGCPPPAPKPPPQQPAAGCPPAKDVYTASYVKSEPGQGRTGWVMPLFDQKADVTGKPLYQTIDAAVAQAAGVPTPPAHVWLLQPDVPPCEAKIGKMYAAAINVPNNANVSYGIELEGCGPPPNNDEGASSDGGEAIAVDSPMNPGQCRVQVPTIISERLGEMTGPTTWKAPTAETPIPAGLTPAIPKHECQSPGCETLWTVLQVTVDNIPAAWAAAVNWLQVGNPATPCDWKVDTFNGFFIPDADGHAMKVSDGQDHPLILAAVLADAGGPKVLFADGAGEYTAYDLGHGAATVGHHVVWLVDDAEAYVINDKIGPQCEAPGSGAGSGSALP
jgi:hypothetical protein|nr:hypothetical protein [Kofleriaceae bacterium]